MGINLKERIIIFKRQREFIKELKADFYEATVENYLRIIDWFNLLLITIIVLFCITISIILALFNINVLSVIIALSAFLYFIVAVTTKLFKLTWNISCKLLFYLFGRYGKVVNSKDWKNIKKYLDNDIYKFLTTKKSLGYCYYCSWVIARFLNDAQIMYCSIQISNRPSGHAVIVKDNCIYDTNERRHYDYDEYIKLREAVVYKIFSQEEYKKKTFFDDIRQGFVDWCTENDVYCEPQQ